MIQVRLEACWVFTSNGWLHHWQTKTWLTHSSRDYTRIAVLLQNSCQKLGIERRSHSRGSSLLSRGLSEGCLKAWSEAWDMHLVLINRLSSGPPVIARAQRKHWCKWNSELENEPQWATSQITYWWMAPWGAMMICICLKHRNYIWSIGWSMMLFSGWMNCSSEWPSIAVDSGAVQSHVPGGQRFSA